MENQNLVTKIQHDVTITEAEARRRLAACYRLLLSLQSRKQDDSTETEQIDAAQAAPDGTLSHK